MDLFKAIFADSSSSSDEEDEELASSNMATTREPPNQTKWQDLSAIINIGPPSNSSSEYSKSEHITAPTALLEDKESIISSPQLRRLHPSVGEEKLAETRQESAPAAFGPALPPGELATFYLFYFFYYKTDVVIITFV